MFDIEKQPTFWNRPAYRFGSMPAVLLGGLMGLCLRITHFASNQAATMTFAFLILGPLAVGYVTVFAEVKRSAISAAGALLLPWPALLLTVLITWCINLEGLICIVLALPVMLVMGSVGGLLAWLLRRQDSRQGSLSAAVILLFPLVGPPMEARLAPPLTYRTVVNEVWINAPPEMVWRNIERVRAIAPGELRGTWAQRIGFPRPLEATLSFEGVGGVRHASFERGLMFVETVTAWEPGRRLAFGIRADTEHLPPTTLDEHVKIGGRYFDVLDGEYRIEPLATGGVVLHLESRERVSTDFNWYAGWWSDRVMGALQGSILQVIRHRCEAGLL